MQARAMAITAPDLAAMNRATTIFLTALTAYLLLCSAVIAACIPGNPLTPMGYVVCEVVYFMYGNLGRGLATLAIVVLGVGALLGKTSWGMAITVGVGISVLFNAQEIASWLICGVNNERMCGTP